MRYRMRPRHCLQLGTLTLVQLDPYRRLPPHPSLPHRIPFYSTGHPVSGSCTKNTALAQVILFAKLLGALLVDDYTERYVSFSPWGYPIAIDYPPPISLAHR
jgi:hypothetical protein